MSNPIEWNVLIFAVVVLACWLTSFCAARSAVAVLIRDEWDRENAAFFAGIVFLLGPITVAALLCILLFHLSSLPFRAIAGSPDRPGRPRGPVE